MKKRSSSIVVGLCIIVLTISCSFQNKDSSNRDFESNRAADTFVKDIPLDRSGKPRSYYRNKKVVEEKLGLNTLEKGVDSLQIRIWYGYAFNDTSQLVIIKNSYGTWSADLFTLIYKLNQSGDSVVSISSSIISNKPNSGWESFIKKMLAFNILTLPDYQAISGYAQSADGDGVIVEVATRTKYRIYSYQAPNMNKNHFPHAKDMEEILELIEKELEFSRLRKL